MSTDADTLIVGAGLSGLSLAVHLIDRGVGGRLLLVDPRTHWDWDRTWCFWPVTRHPFEAAISRRWPRWRVAGQGREIVSDAPGLPYCHLDSRDFYKLALSRLEASGRSVVDGGVEVLSVETRGDQVVAETSDGPRVARLAFDSRPAPNPAGTGVSEVTLLQHFGGLVVRTESAAFDPDCVTMMDFEVDQHGAIRFVYVLPFARDRALVEDTWIGPEPQPVERYEAGVSDYLRRRIGLEDWRIEDRESGVIPMTTASGRRRDGRVIAIGLRGGMAKPSSGYAFLAVQRDSAALADGLVGWSGGPLPDRRVPTPPPVRPKSTLALDRIFLAHLERYPERAADLFCRLFERVEPESLVRFLSEVGDWRDDLRVMRALPPSPLIAEALRSRRLWLRRGPTG